MIEPKLRQLINRDVDGELSDKERARLRESLRRNGPARRLHSELLALNSALASLPAAEPPVHLANRIRAAVHAGDPLVVPAHRRWHHAILDYLPILYHPHRSQEEEAMEQDKEGPSKSPKRSMLVGAAVLAICVVVYFAYYFPAPLDDVSGTIGAAKKYRSEQISDKDVKLAEQGSATATAVKDPADENAAMELRSTASALGRTARELSAKVGFDRAAADNLARAAAELGKTAQSLLDRQTSMEKSAVADMQSQAAALEKSASAALGWTVSRSAAADLERNAASLERTAMAAQPAFDRTAAAEFSRTALSLERAAKELEARQGFDRAASADLQRTSAALDRTAQALSRGSSIDRAAVAELMQQARNLDRVASTMLEAKGALQRAAVSELGQRAQEFQKQASGLERTMSTALEQKASSDQ